MQNSGEITPPRNCVRRRPAARLPRGRVPTPLPSSPQVHPYLYGADSQAYSAPYPRCTLTTKYSPWRPRSTRPHPTR